MIINLNDLKFNKFESNMILICKRQSVRLVAHNKIDYDKTYKIEIINTDQFNPEVPGTHFLSFSTLTMQENFDLQILKVCKQCIYIMTSQGRPNCEGRT